MTSLKELKIVTFTGPAVIEGGRVVGVKFATYKVGDGPEKSADSLPASSIVTTTKEVVEKVYPVGTRVVVLDGANITAKLGSVLGREWRMEKKVHVGQASVVVFVCPDGDIVLEGGAGEYWSPDFLRKAPADGVDGPLKEGDSVICDKPFTEGGTCTWLSSMDSLVGEVGQAERFNADRTEATVKFGDNRFTFPVSSLRRVTPQEASARLLLSAALGTFPSDTNDDAISALVKSSLGKRARKN